jgi:hypothetical protein
MATIQLPAIKDTEFEATAAIDGGALVFRMWGNADLKVNGPLGPFLDSVDDEVRRNGLGEVVADLRELVFMNSSCLREFVRWVAHVEERASPYRIRFLADPAAHWQTRSLQALRSFAPNLVTVETPGAS